MNAFTKFLNILLTAAALLIAIPVFLLTIAAFLGALDWRLDLISHFLPFYLLASLAVLLVFLLLGRKWLSIMTGVFFILNISQILPLYFPQQPSKINSKLKIVQFNVCAPKKDFSPTSRFLLSEQPDLVLLEECNERCFNQLKHARVLKAYPYHFRKSPYRHRLVILSKFPLTEQELPKLHADPAVAFLKLKPHNHPIHLLLMHSTRPSSGAPYYRNQIEQFKQIAKLTQKNPAPFLMVGDLNVSPWSYSFRTLMQQSRLRNSMNGFGFQPSFPTFVPHFEQFPVFPVIPIDHVLISPEFSVLDRHTGPILQSDHLPIIVTLGLKSK